MANEAERMEAEAVKSGIPTLEMGPIKELVTFLEEHKIGHFEIESEDFKLTLTKTVEAAETIQEEKLPQSMFKIVNLADVFDELEEDARRWREERRVGFVSFDEEYNAIVFHHDATTPNYRYWFSLSRIETFEQQMKWLNHLRDKNWFTREVMNNLLDCLQYLGLMPEKGV